MTPSYVVTTGAVAAGATTLAMTIAERWNAETLLEGQIEVNNPFFADAQADPARWMFHSQADFLAASAKRHAELRRLRSSTSAAVILEDRTPFEHHGVYTASARTMGYLSEREFAVLSDIAASFERDYLTPDLLVYREMTEDQLRERVQSRGRAGESDDFDRLHHILTAFKQFAADWTRSPIVRVAADVDLMTDEGRAKLFRQLEGHLPPAG